MVNSGHPCGTRDWVESFTQDASVGCSCDRLPVCRITHLSCRNITRFWNLTEIPPELVSLLGVLCCCCLIDECCCDPSIIFVG